MKPLLVFLSCLMVPLSLQADEAADVAAVLDQLHLAAEKAQTEAYFALFADNAVYIGTDVGEYWSLEEFKSFVAPYFDQGRGWTYTPTRRDISFSSSGEVAWFHEVLDSESYGTSRGTGVLEYGPERGWLIVQYHLTFPIPNDIAHELTDRIKAFEAGVDKPARD